jgi:hypothetical protein
MCGHEEPQAHFQGCRVCPHGSLWFARRLIAADRLSEEELRTHLFMDSVDEIKAIERRLGFGPMMNYPGERVRQVATAIWIQDRLLGKEG